MSNDHVWALEASYESDEETHEKAGEAIMGALMELGVTAPIVSGKPYQEPRPPKGDPIELDFACSCGEEGEAEMEALMQEVTERLAGGSEELGARSIPPGEFITAVVVSLNWDYNAHITRIGNDMWSGVWAETYDGSYRVSVMCDYVEHGFARIWKAFADRAEEKE